MKKNLLIILLATIAMASVAQSKYRPIPSYSDIPIGKPILIADETWITYSKTGAKFVSYSDSAFWTLYETFKYRFHHPKIRWKLLKPKTIRKATASMTTESALLISKWAQTNL